MVTPEEYARYVQNLREGSKKGMSHREVVVVPNKLITMESMKTQEPIQMNLTCSPSEDEAKLNKLEKAWLDYMRSLDRPLRQFIGIQCLTLKLGSDCRFTPDFIEVSNGWIFAYETKGFFRDDAKVKLKVAARMYPWIQFRLVTRKNKEWKIEDVAP